MKCLSCGLDTPANTSKLFKGRILVCAPCFELATAAEKQIEASLAKAARDAEHWLDAHVLSGGLLKPANLSIIDPRSAREDFSSPKKE